MSKRNADGAPAGLVGASGAAAGGASSFFTSCRCRQRGHWARTPLGVTNLSSMAYAAEHFWQTMRIELEWLPQ
jgi:hypothetical protein